MDLRPPQENIDRTVTRSWWLLVIAVVLVGILGFVAMYFLGAQITQEDPITESFKPEDVFVQPGAEWNTTIFVSSLRRRVRFASSHGWSQQ